jgi:sterol desaturase/sphingolipid hydroxylase (fatty acid hydroxylase superfamily)
MFSEIAGHTGLRANVTHPLIGPFLKPFDMDLRIEHHDLHHRFGKGGKNFGKQTRIYDKLFGTSFDCIET